MSRFGHTDWCARDHQCGLGEHRADPILIDLPGHARALLTRVRDEQTGTEHAEIRLRVALTPVEPTARRQLGTLLAGLRDLITCTTTAGRPGRRAG